MADDQRHHLQARVVALAVALLAGCASAKATAPVKPTIASISVRCANAGNSALRQWKCQSATERAEFAAMIVGQYEQPVAPEHFIILGQRYPVWADVIERKTHLRGRIRFADQAVVQTGNDAAVRTMPIVGNGKTVAYATWCMNGEFHDYRPPQPTRAAAMKTCFAFWKRTLPTAFPRSP